MTDKRYQVFVSSTYEDLREERNAVIQALLELDCIPCGMELFPASDDDSWSLIQRVIDDSDYYVVLIAARYGSIGKGGKSFTQMEYEYASSRGKPILGFLHGNPGSIRADRTEGREEARAQLEEFRALVRKKQCKTWLSANDLAGVVSRGITHLMRAHRAVGWVRGDKMADSTTLEELVLLRRKVDELERELSQLQSEPPKGSCDLACGTDPTIIRVKYRLITRSGALIGEYAEGISTNWDHVFSVIGPIMMGEVREEVFRSALATTFEMRLRERGRAVDADLEVIGILEEDFQRVKVQLIALGLIRRDVVAGSWSLTPYGTSHVMQLLAEHKPHLTTGQA